MRKTQINQEEIERLLAMLKETMTNEIMFPHRGGRCSFDVRGCEDGERFEVQIYRGKINATKYNLVALLRIKNIPLLELHVGVNNNHTNPDGERVSGTHWHIYSEKYGRAQAYSAPDIAEENFVENTILFLDRFHVINKPEVGLQQELF